MERKIWTDSEFLVLVRRLVDEGEFDARAIQKSLPRKTVLEVSNVVQFYRQLLGDSSFSIEGIDEKLRMFCGLERSCHRIEWTDERVAMLTSLWRKGYSPQQIVERLECGVSCDAVVKKVSRLGLTNSSKSPVSCSQRRRQHAQVAPKLEAPKGQRATLLTLKSTTCRWPIGDPGDTDFHFCGAKCLAVQSYCDYHTAMAYGPDPRTEEKMRRRSVVE